MQYFAVKVSRQLGHIGVVQCAVCNQQAAEQARLLFAVAAGHNLPIVANALTVHYLGVELVQIVESKLPRIGAKIVAQFTMVGKRCHLLRHGELGELGHLLGRDQVRRFVHSAGGIVDIPQATHIAVNLKTDTGNTLLAQIAHRAQSHRTGTDYRVGFHRYSPARSRHRKLLAAEYTVTSGGQIVIIGQSLVNFGHRL